VQQGDPVRFGQQVSQLQPGVRIRMKMSKAHTSKIVLLIAFLFASLSATTAQASSVSSQATAPAFTLDATIEIVQQCADLVGYRVLTTGGAVDKYSITPQPTKGLIFNSTTGLLSGKPEVVTATTQYSITGTNTAGSATKFFTLTVAQPLATGLYPTCQVVVGTVGTPLTPTVKYYDMGITTEYNFTISPALPAGLKIDELTGVISGTPTAATYKENVVYTVRMDEEDNPETWFVTVTLTVYPKAPETTTTTTTIAPVVKKTTIVCTKGTLTKRVTAVNPKCPAGYKKKK
jgi:hypothetical protein